MTNKPMLSVELRAGLERLLENGYAQYLAKIDAVELRALLDKQSCGACNGCANGCKLDRESPQVQPAAPRQDEPVAYLYRNIRHTLPSMRTQWEPITVAYARARMHNKALAAEGKADESLLGDEFQPLYAEQPAPVAVVMPFKLEAVVRTSYSDGWNEALAEVARLNGGKP